MSSTGIGTVGDINLSPFQNEEAAYRFVEQCVWPEGPVCPRCGGSKRVRPLRGRSVRMGAYKCYACRKPFTVKVGTILESSNLPMRKWLQAIFLTSREGERLDANTLHHALDVAPRTASYVLQRVQSALSAAEQPVQRPRDDSGQS
ncbi:transposase [Vineibacter terrae]|uniref:Transposase n=2 Tax=Vineibacter terrae TaxID=2586908 RepID=A0A5C8PE39_9HYPH|nr:transposase [Vineibacter terrae]TXL71593.1 transposase [Vineibacter terrae]